MADASKLAKQRARGTEAKVLLENELLAEFFAKAEAEALEAWKGSKIDETALREDAWLTWQALQRIRQCFRQTMAEGEFAAKELLRIEKEETNARG